MAKTKTTDDLERFASMKKTLLARLQSAKRPESCARRIAQTVAAFP